jgi:hypothetical protein
MGFRNPVAAGTVSLAPGGIVTVGGPAGLTTPANADVLYKSTPGATNPASGNLTLTDAYEAIAVVMTLVANSTPACFMHRNTNGPPTQEQVTQCAANVPEVFIFPMFASVGDVINVTTNTIGVNASAFAVYGIRRSAVQLRPDGRPRPAGRWAASQSQTAAGTYHIVSSGLYGRPLLLGAMLQPSDVSTFSQVQILATVQGVVVPILACQVGNAFETPATINFGDGLLCDPGTSVDLSIGVSLAGSRPAIGTVFWDQVI